MWGRSWQAKLADQLIQSLRDHPEDWETTSEGNRIRNEHLRISIWAKKSIRHLDVSWKGNMIIPEDQTSWWVPQWRVRLFKAAKYAQKNCGVAKLSVALGDTLVDNPKPRSLRNATRMFVRWHNMGFRR